MKLLPVQLVPIAPCFLPVAPCEGRGRASVLFVAAFKYRNTVMIFLKIFFAYLLICFYFSIKMPRYKAKLLCVVNNPSY